MLCFDAMWQRGAGLASLVYVQHTYIGFFARAGVEVSTLLHQKQKDFFVEARLGKVPIGTGEDRLGRGPWTPTTCRVTHRQG